MYFPAVENREEEEEDEDEEDEEEDDEEEDEEEEEEETVQWTAFGFLVYFPVSLYHYTAHVPISGIHMHSIERV